MVVWIATIYLNPSTRMSYVHIVVILDMMMMVYRTKWDFIFLCETRLTVC